MSFKKVKGRYQLKVADVRWLEERYKQLRESLDFLFEGGDCYHMAIAVDDLQEVTTLLDDTATNLQMDVKKLHVIENDFLVHKLVDPNNNEG